MSKQKIKTYIRMLELHIGDGTEVNSKTVLMRGHRICFYIENIENYPQVIPVTPSYRSITMLL